MISEGSCDIEDCSYDPHSREQSSFYLTFIIDEELRKALSRNVCVFSPSMMNVKPFSWVRIIISYTK